MEEMQTKENSLNSGWFLLTCLLNAFNWNHLSYLANIICSLFYLTEGSKGNYFDPKKKSGNHIHQLKVYLFSKISKCYLRCPIHQIFCPS
jgi:hypothetical protein